MRQRKQITALLLAVVLSFSTLPMNVLAAEAIDAGGLCDRHSQHTEDCYTLVTSCVHEHTAACYPADSVSGNMAAPSGQTEDKPTECTHVCSEESGCITKVLECKHAHDESCSDNPSNAIDVAAVDVQALIDALPGAEIFDALFAVFNSMTALVADNVFDVSQGGVYITQNGFCTITCSTKANPITVGNGVDPVPAIITVSNVTIDLSGGGRR